MFILLIIFYFGFNISITVGRERAMGNVNSTEK